MDFLLTIFLQPKLWRFVGWAMTTGAIALMALGWRIGKVEARVARKFDIEISVINALPESLRWAVPESSLGWAVVMLMFCVGLGVQWLANWLRRQIG